MSRKKNPFERLYEAMFLFDSNLASRDWPGLERHVEDLLRKHSATLVYAERWPDKRLAYEIKGCKKGTYYLTYFRAPPAAIAGLERDCQLSDKILRVLVIQDDDLEEEVQKLLEKGREKSTETAGSPGEPEPARS